MSISPVSKFTLYDSFQKKEIDILSGKTETDKVTIYTCGPTVYYYQHIGNLRAAWLGATITDALLLLGRSVAWTNNITDVGHLVGDADDGEDKMNVAAKRESKTPQQIAQFYMNDYLKQCSLVNITLPQNEHLPKATDYIYEQMALAVQLLTQKRAYLMEDGIYYDSQANSDITVPFKRNTGDAQFTGREIKGSAKSPEDFALWKFVTPETLQKWKFNEYKEILDALGSEYTHIADVWGVPGWHSECVAMICGTLGGKGRSFTFSDFVSPKPVIDIHTGGEDHIDIHHRNEILQSEALGFHLAKVWTHNKFVQVDGAKMAKSVGNVYVVSGTKEDTGFYSIQHPPEEVKQLLRTDYVKKRIWDEMQTPSWYIDPLAFRLLLLEHHYSETLNFTWDKLQQSQNRLFNLRKNCARIIAQYAFTLDNHDVHLPTNLIEVLQNNLNVPKALEIYSELIDSAVKNKDAASLSLLHYIDTMFFKLNLFSGLEVETGVHELALKRMEAKKSKDYNQADQLRKEIMEAGWFVEDYPDGYGLWSSYILS